MFFTLIVTYPANIDAQKKLSAYYICCIYSNALETNFNNSCVELIYVFKDNMKLKHLLAN